MFMKKYVHVSHTYVGASGDESKLSASKNGQHAFPSVPQCCRGKEVGLSVSKLSGEFVPPDPLLLSCLLYAPPFARLLEEPDSVTIWSRCGFTVLQMNTAIPRELSVSKGVISDSAC